MMEDISLCFRHFPQFRKDFQKLLSEGIIKRIAFDRYEWTRNYTTLALYFNWIGKCEIDNELSKDSITGGFWNTIATVFNVKKRTLSNTASRYSNSKDLKKLEKFEKIRKVVKEYRKELEKQEEQKRKDAEQEQNDMETFTAIKTIISNANGDDIKEIRTTFEKIKTVLDFPLGLS